MTENRKYNIDLFLGVSLILFVLIYAIYKKIKLDREGVFTIALANKYEPATQGGNLYVTIFFNGRKYDKILDYGCNDCIGRFFFIKVIPSDPMNGPRLYNKDTVDRCILSQPLPYNGWTEIPQCKK